MSDPVYQSARAVAARVQAYFSRHIDAAREAGNSHVAPKPPRQSVEAMVDAAFWASLRREEGYSPRISLAFLPFTESDTNLMFERPLPLAPDVLTRLAPAVERPGIHLGVWPGPEGLILWGATRSLPAFCLVLEVVAPGVLVIKHRRSEETGKFVNVVVIEGDRIKVIDEQGAVMPDCPSVVASLLGFELTAFWMQPVNVLAELALSMRAHHRGGTLLVVPNGMTAWKDSVVQPVTYSVSPPFSALAELARRGISEHGEREWADSLKRLVDAVAGLTIVDGATIISDQYEVLGFGAKIIRRRGSEVIEQVLLTEPIEGARPEVVNPSQLGGTRHLSAAQFVYDQRGAVALVASQDGRFTVLSWSPSAAMVRAHRVEALLL